ncbi:MAG: TonB family protein [Chitinophagaceae bacterium]|nr:TonB family protein [Chitinophagaceae bacterium]MBP6046005.1 TonB family protein [Ferruginibacter sp.]MBK7346329.1 TonB family protein [Chitinophagaceae bacterium]MBK7735842.1 TonB family protein [Chitinophagaceae bacterium]MBK8775435.1 TonB family protein [Chitinophagaceae bacterium]
MDVNKILNADILDILFDGKNKEYGAYQLRKNYPKTMTRALLITAALILLVFLGSLLANKVAKKSNAEIDVLETQMADIKKDEPLPPPPPPPPPPPTPPPPPEINQVKFVPPKVVKDEEVKPDEKIEEVKEDQAISTKTVESDNKSQVVQAPVEDKGTNVVEAPKVDEDENKIFNKVEVEASYPGGQAKWIQFLKSKLNANEPVDNGAPPGVYQVIVRFIVSKDGTISDVKAETSHGYGMEEEAVRVIKNGPKWTPALQNGRNVNAYRRQPITFQVNEE